MEEEKEEIGFDIGLEKDIEELKLEEDEQQQQQQKSVGDDNVLRFLDSMDSYLTLFDSLSHTLRQGWLELAGARHSMGASRINSALLDLKVHSASTLLQVSEGHDSMEEQPHFILRKWGSLDCSRYQNSKEGELQAKPGSPRLRQRGNSQVSEITSPKQAALKVDDQVQKERSRSLSVFGTLVSPKLRDAQLSFETALETIVEIANMRSEMLSAFDGVNKELRVAKEKR
ncbi:coiled-coil domain-containing protein 115 isoform X2 [Jatropha curcas]|uniref:coiled-coil domain-containing protein 115 isoform X2 n=1 Tax=Jatropha curcas TaxID=180498 RepID=UPI0005FBC453|nr:coiled-coil domain-containing protein 115 isoform X2 [Jatropha curcas]